ncbi:undecaprenyl-diphosphate phosphatase [Planctobacterium marinum]|uniref:undecaprenyl-diphosphate phosphatase n=1 Tax=Planctobacterium marinum TaxID=1631968 RepID=UPI001E5B32EB|nr:undecaprenyl-diphosphate phosphatase [Planctobacterium marinum]MCC2604966.1 undecaprenyl-diphosphate phosphatase [Planctobacterium marinum]
MSLPEIIILALIQGLSEFLPISSSAHLILPSQLFGWHDQGLAFDVAVHVGSLLAVVSYFRKEVLQLTVGWGQSLTGNVTEDGKLAWMIILATLPVIIVGFLVKDYVEGWLRSGYVIATTTIVFGLLLYWADKVATRQQGDVELTWKKALIVGLAQVAAIIPGTSRSGVTMTAALFLGISREKAARFSFLLSIPTILGAGTILTYKLLSSDVAVNWEELFYGVVLSFISAYICITLFLKWISTLGMTPFVIYRIVLGIVIFAVLAI